MKKIIIVLMFIALNYTSFGQNILNDTHWETVWEDNFNSFDANKWTVVNYAQHGDQELQIYMANAVTVNNGNLLIKATNTQTYCPPSPPTVRGGCWPCDNKWYNYTSGWVESKAEFNFKYGLVQARIKLPYGRGFWPAFWTFLGSGVPSTGSAAEIDIFEMLGHLPPNVITTNIHHVYANNPPSYYQENIMPTNYSNDYHNYAVAWSPTKIVWYVDGAPIRIFKNNGIVDFTRVIFNFAIFKTPSPNNTTPFPSEMLIDYIKISKLKNDCLTDINTCNFNFSTYNNRVKQKINIGGAGCTNTVPNAQNVYLRASESFKINSKFTVPLGSTFFVDVNPCH
jgi:beta-glucanase (GH16 family)